MATREPKITAEEGKWIGLDDVLLALQTSMQQADDKLSKMKGSVQYAVTEISISFPAEMRVEANRTIVRLPRQIGDEKPKISEAYLSRLTFSLKPIPSIQK
jgi:hypothetical protein